MTQQPCSEQGEHGKGWKGITAYCSVCHEPICFRHYRDHVLLRHPLDERRATFGEPPKGAT